MSSCSDITSSSSASTEDTMKRAAVRQRIECFYHQLTEGCGKPDCSNDCCASSHSFQYKSLSRDQAAAKALALFQQKAQLCQDSSRQFKVAKSDLSPTDRPPAQEESSAPSCVSVSLKKASEGGMRSDPIPGCSSSKDEPVQPSSTSSAMAQPSQQKAATAPQSSQVTTYLTESMLDEIVAECEASKSWSRLIRTLGAVFNNSDSVMHSFLRAPTLKPDPPASPTKEEIRSMEVDMDKDKDEHDDNISGEAGAEGEGSDHSKGEAEAMDSSDSDDISSGLSTVRESSAEHSHRHVKLKEKVTSEDDNVTVDVVAVRNAFTKLFAIPESPFQSALTIALRQLARSMEMELRHYQPYSRDANYLNIFIIIFEILLLDNRGDLENAIPHILKAAGLLPVSAQVRLTKLWAQSPPNKLKEMLSFLHQVITLRILSSQWSPTFTLNDDDGITGAARVMKIVFYASILGGDMDPPQLIERETAANKEMAESLQELLEGAVGRDKEKSQPKQDPLELALGVHPLDCRKPLIPWQDFINDLVSEGIRMEKDYTYYKGEMEHKFSFLTHSFILTTAVKNLGMYYDSKIRMVNERRVSLLQSLVNGAPTMPYLRIRIRRDHIIDDALVNLEMIAMDNPQDLKKQLYVEFEEEQGIDEGGVSKEFFQLVVEEIFNPDIGMFVFDEDTGNFWFNSTSFENDSQFTLIGIVLGLAIYNNIILDVHFPMVVYRKLMGKLGTFDDLKQSHPVLAQGLQALLDCDTNVEDTYMQTFCLSYKDVFGATITTNLKEGGDKIAVTDDNRTEYVDLYADFLLNKSIEKQFRAFKRGFQMVTDESPLKMLFQPMEVELLVCGSKQWDFQALEDATDYDGGFTPDTPVIKFFWEVVHEFSEDQKKKLLQFTTGSDRVPVGGLAKLKLVIARHGPDSDRLPTAHTCFNVLLLPDYSSKEKLKERLTKAIFYAKGFGML